MDMRIYELEEQLAAQHEGECGDEVSGEFDAWLLNQDSDAAKELRALKSLTG